MKYKLFLPSLVFLMAACSNSTTVNFLPKKYCTQVNAGAGGLGVVCCSKYEFVICGINLEDCYGDVLNILCSRNVVVLR